MERKSFSDRDLAIELLPRNASVDLGRRLQTTITNDLPDDATEIYMVKDGDAASQACHPAFCQFVQAYAGVDYVTTQLQADDHVFGGAAGLGLARLKVVSKGMSFTMADAGGCLASAMDDWVVAPPWSDQYGTPTTVDFGYFPDAPTKEGGILRAASILRFRMGGAFRFCYSDDGSFTAGNTDVTGKTTDDGYILVSGIFDNSAECVTTNCLSERPYFCYLRKELFNTVDEEYGLTTSCIIDYSGAGEGFEPSTAPGKGTWSAEWTRVVDDSGFVQSVTPQACTTEPADFICRNGGACDEGDPYITPVEALNGNANANIRIPAVREDLVGTLGAQAFHARSVAACYCPSLDGCVAAASFVQQVGILHFFASKVCDAGTTDCAIDRSGVTSQYRFRVRVECPADTCPQSTDSRIKLVERTADNDLPSWWSLSTCSSGIHGQVQGTFALPEMTRVPLDGTQAGVMNPANCVDDDPLNCQLQPSSGSRQDYKEFGGVHGFRFKIGYTAYEERNFHGTKEIDVCFCIQDCTVASNWFKTGGMRLGPTRFVSAATSRSNLPEQWMVEFMLQRGVVGLYRPYADADIMGLQENSLLKIVADESRAMGDIDCATAGYDSQLTEGLANEVSASMNYLARRQTNFPADLQKLVFNSNALVNTITVRPPGTIAVCYCGITAEAVCEDPENWKLVSHVLISGPLPNQMWSFSTNVDFRFTYEGYGLSSGDTLRIIASDGQCNSDNNNPDTAAFLYTGLYVGCPVGCTAVTSTSGAEPGDLSTITLSNTNYECNRMNVCPGTRNDISSAVVLSTTETELTFQNPHGLEEGQAIVLGANIFCKDPQPAGARCTDEMVAALRGEFEFADYTSNNALAPNTYKNPHRVKLTDDAAKIIIGVGWPTPVPEFEVIYANPDPGIGYIGEGGEWRSLSRGMTREEIKGVEEKANLRVCWQYGGVGAKYVTEVGRLTLRNPAPMVDPQPQLSLTTTLRGTRAPMILTFTTAGGVTGDRYNAATDSLRLKMTFTRTDLINVYYSNLEADDIPDTNPGSEEIEDATQAVCGQLFLEMWSEDMSRGFPMPKGCYFKTWPTANTRELYILLEPRSGFSAATTYQLVFNGEVIYTGAGAPDPLDQNAFAVHQAFEGIELFIMDDLALRRYEAIERGLAYLTTEPQKPGGDAEDPSFLDPDGFKIIGGHDDLLELHSGDTILFEFMGHPTSGWIRPTHIIRIYLWPLTQWKTTASCIANCETAGDLSYRCEPDNYGRIPNCMGVPAVPDQGLNIIKLTLPDDFEPLFGNKKVRIRLGGITIPSGGFFANRLAAQVTTEFDDKPFYQRSLGDYIWKQPNIGQPVSKIVSTYGGGNEKPYRGQDDNIYYLNILLSTTIYARDNSYQDAKIEVTLPEAYTVVDQSSTSPAGVNAFEASPDLPVFVGVVPQGRGVPVDPKSATYGWTVSGNTITFKPEHPYGVIYAGSSFYVKLYVDNPDQALARSDPGNMWTITYTNKGLHASTQTTDPILFSASGSIMFQPNMAVLGVLSEATCQPNIFAASDARESVASLSFFFRTEQEIAAGGYVLIDAPSGFAFVNPCNATDLPDSYYTTKANPTDATLRLPGILSCIPESEDRRAAINVESSLVAGRKYAVKVDVRNPFQYYVSQTQGWYIFTADADRYMLDGTPDTVAFSDSDDTSWGVYTNSDMALSVTVLDLRPYVMRTDADKRTLIQVIFTQLPAGDPARLRLRAPEGYIWEFTDAEFIYQLPDEAPAEHASGIPPGITASFPGGIPLPRQADEPETLLWNAAAFSPLYIYGIGAYARVPTYSPSSARNIFSFEIGYDSTQLDDRLGAAQIPAPLVRALTDAEVEYTTNVKAKENRVQFTVQIVTAIPPGGGIEIHAPEDFFFSNPCELIPVTDPSASPPPAGLSCHRDIDPARTGGIPVLLLEASVTVPPGLLQFAILCENPQQELLNYDTRRLQPAATPCGTFICWTYFVYANVRDYFDSTASSGELDYFTYAQGFSINSKMLEARIPYIDEIQRQGTGRDDRPLQPNHIVFAFKLVADVTQSGPLTLRAPWGFNFLEDCMSVVEVRESHVFGYGNRFPTTYEPWPVGVNLTDCYGAGWEAKMYLTMEPGAALAYNKLYAFRIGVTANPWATPSPNRWTIQLGAQSSDPFEGMELWAFTQTSLTPISTARDRTLAGETRLRNALRIRFIPRNTLESNGLLKAEAPLGFSWVYLPSGQCNSQLTQLPYSELGVPYAQYDWPEESLVCLVDMDSPGNLQLESRDTQPMTAGLEYELILYVYNPTVILSTAPTTWYISSYDAAGTPMDMSAISAFAINPVMNLWSYENPDPDNPGEDMRNGLERLPQFSLLMRFPDRLINGDRIHIIAPDTYVLTDSAGRCAGLRWISDDPAVNANGGYSPLPSSQVYCNLTELTVLIYEPVSVVQDTLLQLGLDIYNPEVTPDAADNYWTCTHYFSDGRILSSKAFEAWQIVPQLTDLQVDLLGPYFGATMSSTIRVGFMPVTLAEDVAIRLNYPRLYDFTGVTLDDPLEQQEIILIEGDFIRIRQACTPGVPVEFVINGVLLGEVGGQTSVTISTWSGGMLQGDVWKPGEKQDEKLDFMGGFRQPGILSLRYEYLYNDYMQDPVTYPVQSVLDVQMGRPCYAEFRFTLSYPVEAGSHLVVSAVPYLPSTHYVVLEESGQASTAGAGESVARAIGFTVEAVDGELQILLLEDLIPDYLYRLVLSVIAPYPEEVAAAGGPIMWTIETRDAGMLPTNTNDAISTEFHIVEEFSGQVYALLAPPVAYINLIIRVRTQLASFTELRVTAPSGFSFIDNCLVDGGYAVVSCRLIQATSDGRSQVALETLSSGISGQSSDIEVRIFSPGATPADRTWYLVGVDAESEKMLGWGEANGFYIQQMLETEAMYPGVPNQDARAVFRFRTQVRVDAGGWLEVALPEGLRPECAGNAMEPINMPPQIDCIDADPRILRVWLNSTIFPGLYAFAIRVAPPPSTPVPNEISLILKNKDGEVQDAAVDMPAPPIQENLNIIQTQLLWSSSRPGRQSIITIGFECVDQLPDLIIAADQQVQEILIVMPVGFVHQVERTIDFTLLNEDMPLADGVWLDYLQKDRLKITLDLDGTTWTPLKAGAYDFRFPVLVPSPLPDYNVWFVTLCKASYPNGCMQTNDAAALMSFPYPGFELGEPAPAQATDPSLIGATAFACRQARPPLGGWLCIMLSACAVCLLQGMALLA